MQVRIRHHKELWCSNPEWTETTVEVRVINLRAGDVITDNPWGDNPYKTNPAYFDIRTGKHHTWGQGHDELDDFAFIVDEDLPRVHAAAAIKRAQSNPTQV